jgi:hypothetical protein
MRSDGDVRSRRPNITQTFSKFKTIYTQKFNVDQHAADLHESEIG